MRVLLRVALGMFYISSVTQIKDLLPHLIPLALLILCFSPADGTASYFPTELQFAPLVLSVPLDIFQCKYILATVLSATYPAFSFGVHQVALTLF